MPVLRHDASMTPGGLDSSCLAVPPASFATLPDAIVISENDGIRAAALRHARQSSDLKDKSPRRLRVRGAWNVGSQREAGLLVMRVTFPPWPWPRQTRNQQTRYRHARYRQTRYRQTRYRQKLPAASAATGRLAWALAPAAIAARAPGAARKAGDWRGLPDSRPGNRRPGMRWQSTPPARAP